MVYKLKGLGMNCSLCSSIESFLTERPQVGRKGNCTSSSHTVNIGVPPQGCVVCFYSLYTHDCSGDNAWPLRGPKEPQSLPHWPGTEEAGSHEHTGKLRDLWLMRKGCVGIKYKLSYKMSLIVKLAMSCMLEQVVFSSLCGHEWPVCNLRRIMSTADPKRGRKTNTLFDGFTVSLFYCFIMCVCVSMCLFATGR